MPRKGDRDLLVNSLSQGDFSVYGVNPERPDSNSASSGTLGISRLQRFCASSNQLNLIYVSIIAVLAAISVALVITIFVGSPQVTPHAFLQSNSGYCSNIGKDIMVRKRGNAVDALVSTILCLSVTRPDVISIGGCGAFIVHKRDTNKNHLFDAMCTSPADFRSSSTVGVPGLVAGLKEVHDKFGYLYWADLFTSALDAATNGFQAERVLLLNVERVKIDAPPDHFIHKLSEEITNGTYPPQLELATSLRKLASDGISSFYGGSIGRSIVSTMGNHNVSWSLEGDLGNYAIKRPAQLELGMAGFSVYGFPAPFVGGALATSLLANLDLLNHLRPLNARRLALGDAAELALLYHRLIELTKFAVAQISALGDPYDRDSGSAVSGLEAGIMNATLRKRLVESIDDNIVLPTPTYGSVEAKFFDLVAGADSFGLTVESDMLIASATLILGGSSPFGSGIVTPDTGIILNAAQTLFSTTKQQNLQQAHTLNVAGAGRRPLVPVSPVFFQTAQQKCGHRFVAASTGGLRGMVELSQLLMSSFLYLSNVTCSVESTDGAPLHSGPRSHLPTGTETTVTYSPAVGSCLPLRDSLALKRLYVDYRLTNGSANSFVVMVEPGFPAGVMAELVRRGHEVVVDVAGSVAMLGAAGWTMYTTIGGIDKSTANTTAYF